MNENKPFLKSKTVWINFFIFLLAIYEYVNGDLLTAFGISAEKQPQVMSIAAFVVAVINIWLRMNATQQVTIKKDKQEPK